MKYYNRGTGRKGCMDCRVYYESWQMDCCGESFAIGDVVCWTVCACPDSWTFQTVDIGKIDYCYENHLFDHGPYYDLEGTVTDIMILYEKHESSKSQSSMSVPVRGVLKKVSRINRYKKGYNEMSVSGYIVTLKDIKMELSS